MASDSHLRPKQMGNVGVVDGQVGAQFDLIANNTPTFARNGALEYLAVESGSLYRIQIPSAP